MKKISSSLLLLMLVALLFVGCSKNTASDSSAKEVSQESTQKTDSEIIEDYLSEPLHISVPYIAGGGADNFIRIIAKYLAQEIGTNVIIDNLPGADGILALTKYQSESPNTRTIVYANSQLLSYLVKSRNTAYTRADFDPIISMQLIQFGLYASPQNTDIKNMEDLKEYAANNRVVFGCSGKANPIYFVTKSIFDELGPDNDTVVYSSGSQGIINNISNDTQVIAVGLNSTTQFVEDGTLTPLAVLSTEDYSGPYGDLDSISKYGFEDMSADMLTMFLTRSGTDEVITNFLNQSFKNVLANEGYIEEMAKVQNLKYVVMDKDEINDFLDVTDRVTDKILAK